MARSLKVVPNNTPEEEIAASQARIRPNIAARLFEEAQAMELADAEAAGTMGFMGRALVQATLPYKEPDRDLRAWGRRAGNVSLVIQPGVYFNNAGETQSIGYPYGSYPRLLLAWIATEACRTKERQLILGQRLSDFLEALGYTSHNGGPRGNITRIREQMKRLFAAHIAIVYGGEDNADFSHQPFLIADKSDLWWDPQRPQQAGLWQSTVTLSERFYEEVARRPVPIDLRALRALRQSPIALDLYCWLTYRMFSLRAPVTVPWEALKLQFGSEAVRDRKFRETISKQLHQVLSVYPAKVTPEKAGLFLEPSRTSVPRLVQGWEAPLDQR